jgi:hypothetical protein
LRRSRTLFLLLAVTLAAFVTSVSSAPQAYAPFDRHRLLRSGLGQAPPTKAYLLNVGKGQIFNDTGMDDKTKPELVESKELGGKAVKVVFFPADSVGDRVAKVTNWKPHSLLRANILNSGKQAVTLTLTVLHARSTNYDTRIVLPVKLDPGRNEVRIDIDSLTNVNGSAPALTSIRRWYFADEQKKGPTIYFGDIWLEKDATTAGGTSVGGPHPLVGYRVKGKVGNLDVDLTFTPFLLGGAAANPASSTAKVKVEGDPARLARIRKAKMPKVAKPILFNTPEADAICSALEVYPPNNPWNLVVENWPLHPNSKNIIASIGPKKPFRYNPDMGFVLVPPDQKKINVKNVGYAAESDKGPFPVPNNIPIEGWPVGYKGLTLDAVQRKKEEGDRHAIVVDPTNRVLYEFYQMRKTDDGWQTTQTSIFNLKSNKLRPDGWTSADAAGLPIFPAVVRYDELKRGIVEHAMRVTVVKTRRAYVYPATHFASRLTDENLPRMGERIRLRKDYDISGFSPDVQAILKGLKKYGMFVADNGIDWAISVAPDPRMKDMNAELRKIQGSAFEVVTPPEGYEPPEE